MFSGLPRLYAISMASWGRIIGAYRPDVYIHSWIDPHADQSAISQMLEMSFHPVQMRSDPLMDIDTSAFPDRHWPYVDVYRSLSMWHGIRRVHEMVKSSGKEYDIIIRSRTDLYVKRFEMVLFDGISLPFCHTKLDLRFIYQGRSMHGLNDLLAYGSPAYMEEYVNSMDDILPLYRDEGVDYCPENFLAASLFRRGIPVYQQPMQHQLIRG